MSGLSGEEREALAEVLRIAYLGLPRLDAHLRAADAVATSDWLTAREEAAEARGRAAALQELEEAAREWATMRFDEHGPMDARGAALWDVAGWLREEVAR